MFQLIARIPVPSSRSGQCLLQMPPFVVAKYHKITNLSDRTVSPAMPHILPLPVLGNRRDQGVIFFQ
eukprot:2513988-Karenia_brevis.AAC.1